MQICEEKGCWLKDLKDVPADELPYWIAHYELKQKDIQRARKRSERDSKGKRR